MALMAVGALQTAYGDNVEDKRDLKAAISDELLRNVLSPNYFFHVPVGEGKFAYPLFSRSLYLGSSVHEQRCLLLQALRVLEVFNLYHTSRYIAALLDVPYVNSVLGEEVLETYVEENSYDLLERSDCIRFARSGSVGLDCQFGIRTVRRKAALVLGPFFPHGYALAF